MGDALLYTMGRQGNTDSMDLANVGLEADGRGLLEVRALGFIVSWEWFPSLSLKMQRSVILTVISKSRSLSCLC